MNRYKYIILFFIAISALTGCSDDEKPNTSHPDKGGIVLTVDWSDIESDIPSTYKACIVYASGQDTLFDNLSGTINNLVVKPGKAVLYVYNEAEHIHVEGGKATIINDGEWIPSDPGLFYSFSTEIYTERDKDINQVALMKQQTGELTFSIAVKPAHLIDKLKSVTAVLDGIASELDMQTNEISAPYKVQVNFTKNANYATSNVRLLGIMQSNDQYIRLNYGFEYEFGEWSFIHDTGIPYLILNTFNESRNKPFTLYSSIIMMDDYNTTYTFAYWYIDGNGSIFANPTTIALSPSGETSETVSVITEKPSWNYYSNRDESYRDWLTISKSDSNLTFSATPNMDNNIRKAEFFITSESNDRDRITVIQNSIPENDIYKDRETVRLQRATVGKGINIVLMGDGYTRKDLLKGTGKYEQDMIAAAEAFFSVYPFTEFRNYFNVYMVAAISSEEGISVKSPFKNVNTKFFTRWDGEGSTYITCNDYYVRSYVNAIPELSPVNIHDLTVIMPINANIFAGTTYMYRDTQANDNFGNGLSISLCPVGVGFEEIVVHEAGGHGFAKVNDEYVNYPDETIPEYEKNYIVLNKAYGWYENMDIYGNISQTSWKGFANQSKYSMVGTFEGAYYYGKGVWRPEFNSCMNNNIPYFNAPTRWAQVRRIHQLAGINYSFSQFLQDDKIPEYPANTRSKAKDFIPLAPPVIKTVQQ